MANVWTPDELFNHLAAGVHNWSNPGTTAVFKVALCLTAPTKAGTAVLADITQIAATGGYTPGTITMTWAETAGGSGIWQLGGASSDLTFTPSGAAFADFRYAVLYNDTPTSPADPVIAVLDYGQTISLANGQPFDIDAGANGWVRFTNPAWA